MSRLVVGLGNPGRDYEFTRHNVGFLAVARVAEVYKVKFTKSASLKSFVGRGEIEGEEFFLLLPLTYMNNSGQAVQQALQTKNISLDQMLVICDDLNLAFGQMRLRPRGSSGGHNGLNSIIAHLGANEFARLRLGLGSPARKEEAVDFVLSEFNSQEKKELNSILQNAVDCCRVWLTSPIGEAMNQFNKKEKQ